MTSFLPTVATVFRKEMWEHFRTWRLIVIGGIFAFVFIVISLYGGILAGGGSTELSFKGGANSVLGLVLAFTSFFPGLMAIVISYTSIVGERSRKSLILLVSKPIKRPALFLGKFLSSYFAIVLVYMVVMTAGYIGVVGASGKMPSPEDVGRAYGAVAFVLMAMACWVSFAMFLSAALKNPITVVVAAIMSWFLIFRIVSSIGVIYWAVSSGAGDNVPNDIGVAAILGDDQRTSVIFTGAQSTSYSFHNESGGSPGQRIQTRDVYSILGLPPGNYTWSAKGGGISSNGTLVLDGVHQFSVSYVVASLEVTVSPGLNATLARNGQPIAPSNAKDTSMGRTLTFSGTPGACRLRIGDGNRTVFSGGYDLSGRPRGGFGAMASGTPPDYVKYDQLINPDNAMTGYTQVLDPSAQSTISPSDGAIALAIFFLSFFILGLLAFSKMEMV